MVCFGGSLADRVVDANRTAFPLCLGYVSARPLTTRECEHFVGFMQIALLCNCAWRFKNFNVDHPELPECKDAHRELQVFYNTKDVSASSF